MNKSNLSTHVSRYLQDVIVPEEKQMNEDFKKRYLREVEEQLLTHGKMLQRFNKINIVETQQRTREIIAQSSKALLGEIDRMKAIDEYKVKQFGADWVKGPMKWLILVLGPNHHFSEIKHLLEGEHK